MPIRITGLNSGLDTESIISALVSSYNYKTQKYKKAQTKLSWKQDAWKDLNTKIYSLYNSVSNLRFSSAYNLKATTVSDSTKVSVSAGSNSINGSYSVQVTSLAKSGYLTGGRLEAGTTESTKLSELGISESQKFTGTGTFSVTAGGKTTDITVDENTTVKDVVNKLKEAGVNASYDATNRRIFVSAKETGKTNDFALSVSDKGGADALAALGLSVESEASTEQYKALAAYYKTDYDTTLANIKSIINAKTDATANNAKLNTENSNLQAAVKYANAVDAINKVGANGSAGDFETLKSLVSMGSLENKYVDADGTVYTYDEESQTYSALKEQPDGSFAKVEQNDATGLTAASDKYDELVKSFGLVKNKVDGEGNEVLDDEGNPVKDTSALTAFKENLATVKDIAEKADTDANADLQSLLQDIETAASSGNVDEVSILTASYEQQISDNKDDIARNNAILAADEMITVNTDAEAFAKKAEYAAGVVDGSNSLNTYKTANRVDGSDAIIYVNGAEYTGTSNTFSINGMTFTASGITGEQYDATETKAVNVTVNTDTQGLYDKIKDFLTQYNSIVNEMTKLYNSDSAKGYEPLTDEEKEAMSDTEVEKWEEKIKSSLLRRDDTLSGIISAMTNAMSKGICINGQNYYLSSFGIKTLGYFNAAKNEQNAYHIDGDQDDVNTAGNADKLMAAITEDPDTVVSFMQGLAKNLYESVDTKMKSTTLSSIYTVYNDKEMASEYSDYTSLITKWQERLEQQEEYYYQKFAAMETALSKLNSQTSSLTGLFG